ncbi:hypothetical protein HJG60_009052 [Phyllostomus discolor]|uniref:Uncharacterized protein n=1 Tax=Phyllostomus discolor TaxID=89673 RepID=A0A833YJF8_9CHIR|nr:hypothetical protein HJG60_009052 [Phyllostomus discolor]
MSQKSQSGQQSNQSDLLPDVPNSDTQDETQQPSPITYRPRVGVQDPPSILHTRRVSLQDPPPVSHTRRVSIQEPLPMIHPRRVSIQDPSAISYSRRVSIQEPLPISHSRRVSIQEPPSILHTRRVSIQEPLPMTHTRRVSIQEPSPMTHTRRISIQELPSMTYTHRVSIQETLPLSNSHEASFQDSSSVPYSSNFHAQHALPGFQTSQFSLQSSSSSITHDPHGESVATISTVGFQGHLLTTHSLRSSTEGSKLPIRAKIDIPPSITNSPEASINSIESILRASHETSKSSLANFQFTEDTLDPRIRHMPPGSSADTSSNRFRDVRKRKQSQLPLSRRLLHEARKISRHLSLLLSLAGMAILSFISLGQPWMHFQVPLTPPGDPAGPLTIPIDTILFVRCTDISCLQEHDYKAYLLDSAWISLIIASVTGSCLCLILINLIFFSSSNFPILDFSIIVISVLTGTSIILGVLFYLMQAHEFLQEGMTYRLGRSFYLAWMGIFFFLMTGFFSFLNYINFWSILALQAIWT